MEDSITGSKFMKLFFWFHKLYLVTKLEILLRIWFSVEYGEQSAKQLLSFFLLVSSATWLFCYLIDSLLFHSLEIRKLER